MEGLKGTAIRSAVRDPGSPQAPVPARARRLPALMKGLLLRVAQATTTHTGSSGSFRGSGPRVGIPARKSTAGAGPGSSARGPAPVVPAGCRHRPHQPDPASLGQGRIAIDMDLETGPAILTKGVHPPRGAPSGDLLTCPLGRSLRSRRRGDGASATLDSPALPGGFRQLSDEAPLRLGR